MRSRLLQLLFRPLQSFGISASLQSTALWTMLESFSSAFFSLMLIPILTHNLGLEKYGLYVMVTAFVSFFSFAGLGMNTSITYYLAVNHQAANTKNIAERLGSALSLTLIGTVTFSCACLLVLSLYVSQLQALYPQLSSHQNLVYAALILIVITQLDLVISAALKGLQQFKTSSKIEFTIRLLGFLIIAMVAITQKNVTAIIIATIITAFFSLIIRYKTLSKVIALHLSDIKLTRHYVSELFHFGKWMTLQNISGAIFGSLDKIVLGIFFGTKIVGVYNILVSITQLSHYLLASASSFILPKVSASKVDIKVMQKNYYKSLIVCALVTLSVRCILALMFPLIKSYFHLDNINSEYFILLVCYGILAMCVPPYNFSLGLGSVKILSNINTISAFVGMAAILMFINMYGMLGAVLARVAYTMCVVFTFAVPPLLFKKDAESSNEDTKILKFK